MNRNLRIAMVHRIPVANKSHDDLVRAGDLSRADDPYPFARVYREHRTRMLTSSIQGDLTPSRIRLVPSRPADRQFHPRNRISELLARIYGLEIGQMRRKRHFDWH